MASSKRKFKKARRNGTLPGKGKGRPPGVPWTAGPNKRRASGGFRSNPPLLKDVAEFILPGFGGFVATRAISRVTGSLVSRRWPRFAKHAGALSTVGSFFLAWFAAHRVKQLAPYHTPIVVGSGIAALQTVVQTYIPTKYSWLVGHTVEDPAVQMLDEPTAEDLATEDLGNDRVYYAGQHTPPASSQRAGAGAQAQQQEEVDTDPLDDLMSDMNDEQQESYGGVFSTN